MARRETRVHAQLLLHALAAMLNRELEAVLKIEGQSLAEKNRFSLRTNFTMQSTNKCKDSDHEDIRPVAD